MLCPILVRVIFVLFGTPKSVLRPNYKVPTATITRAHYNPRGTIITAVLHVFIIASPRYRAILILLHFNYTSDNLYSLLSIVRS